MLVISARSVARSSAVYCLPANAGATRSDAAFFENVKLRNEPNPKNGHFKTSKSPRLAMARGA